MNGLGRTTILTMVSLLFLVTHSYAYSITYGGVDAFQDGVKAGLTADKSGIDPMTNTANLAEGWFIETFDLADGSGGFNTLDPAKLTVEGGYGFSDKTISGAAAPANDETNFFFTPNVGGTLPSSVKVPNTAFIAFQPGLFIDYLGLYFGSIDTYNSLEFFTLENDDEPFFIITGQEILNALNGQSGNQFQPGSNGYVNINFDLPGEVFTAFAVKTTGVALEIDNIVAHVVPVAPVPEPSTFILLGAGLLGFVALGRKRFAQ
jgi:hypothetical protein